MVPGSIPGVRIIFVRLSLDFTVERAAGLACVSQRDSMAEWSKAPA